MAIKAATSGFIIAALLALAACGIGGQAPPGAGTPFTAALAREYEALADRHSAFSRAGMHFSAKAAAARNGEKVRPDDPRQAELGPADRSRALAAHARLNNLDSRNRGAFPKDAARAQASFDCWLKALETEKTASAAACEKSWSEAVAHLECAGDCGESEPREGRRLKLYKIYFGLESDSLDDKAQIALDQAALDFAEKYASRVYVSGYADRSGSIAYNRELARRRALAVAESLIRRNVPSALIVQDVRGEAGMAVATDDDAKLDANRRVEIDLRK